MNIWLVLALVVWIVCGVLAYGLTFAYFQDNWPALAWSHRVGDRVIASTFFLMGPGGLFVAFVGSRCRYGLRYRAITAEASWAAHQKRWPSLTREDWAS